MAQNGNVKEMTEQVVKGLK